MKRKKWNHQIVAGILIFAMLITCVPLIQVRKVRATSKSASEAISWVKSQVGSKVGSGQCVALITAYYSYLGVSPSSGNAKDYATNALPAGWSRVKGGTPQLGDILVYSASAQNSYGHVAIFESTRSTYHQNVPDKNYKVTHETYAYNGFLDPYWGYIRPNWSSTPPGNNPIGCIDLCQSDEIGKLHIRGWSYDADNPSTQNEIHLYIGPNENDQELHNLGPANGYRDDVDKSHHCGAYHGIDKTISTSRTGNQRVRIYAINVGAGNNTLIYDQTVNIKSDSEAPVLVGYDITDLNDKGYTIICTWEDNVGVTKVEFPTWDAETLVGDDATWYQGSSSEAGKTYSTWNFTFSKAEAGKKYFTHIYAWDAAGNRTCFPLTPTTPIARPIETKNDTTAPVFENVALIQEEKGTVKLSVQLSDNTGLGKLSRPGGRFLWYSADENSSCILADYSTGIKSNINCWNNQVGSVPILEKKYTVEETTSVQCDSIVGYGILAQDLSGNYAKGNSLFNNEYISYQIRSGNIKGQKETKSIEVRLNQGESITLGEIREKLSQFNSLDGSDANFDAKNERILKKSNHSDSNMISDREEEKKVVLTANEAGIEYVYFLNLLTGDLCSCKIQVKGENIGDVYQDGVIDGKDVSLLLQYRLKKRDLTEEQIVAGDVYADGVIDGKDVSKLLQYRLGKINSLE